MQSISSAVPADVVQPAAVRRRTLPLKVQLVSVVVPDEFARPPPLDRGRVAAERAVGECGRAERVVVKTAAIDSGRLAAERASVSVAVPP